MKRVIAIATLGLLLCAAPAWAGESKKCPETTQTCLDGMVKHFQSRGWVGLELESAETGELTITKVEPDSPAKAAGLLVGDKLTALNGIRFSEENKEAMKAAQAKMTVGATVTYTVDRGGKPLDVNVTLQQIPEAVMAKWVGRHMLEHASVEVAQKE